jgi:hypothetical protein
MRINTVSTGYADPALRGRRAELSESTAGPAAALAESPAAAAPSAIAQIVAAYDVSNISPTEFSEMVQKLYVAGAISEGDLQELAGIRLDLESGGIGPDEKVNLKDFYARQLREAQSQSDDDALRGNLASLARRLDWVEKLAILHAQPNGAGVDAVV